MNKLQVVIEARTPEAKGVVKLVLRRPTGAPLPAFTAGSHIDLFLPNGLIRQYSLINDSRDTDHYEIAISKAVQSRGGSACVHDQLQVGEVLDISEPRNNFALQTGHDTFQFIAGGIGITPILSMIRYCETQGLQWRLLYLARSRDCAAFVRELEAFGPERVRFHFDDEAACLFDFTRALDVAPGVPIYCCGPAPVMNAVAAFSATHPDNPAYFEWFTPPASETTAVQASAGFDVQLKRSGQQFHVPEDQSILDVLEAQGYELACSCREGMCRTCETTVLEGTPEHRDYVLSSAEREAGRTMMICVSRAKSPLLVLDL